MSICRYLAVRRARRQLKDAEHYLACCEDAHERYGVYGDMVEQAQARADWFRAVLARVEKK